ncbi:MAG: 16S rRNA (adenine(1518)-N(6)/adenine(1519)-N(6))-dimethyltransferase RsmA [Bacteroidales bacterium]|nr:16S rRNA (adenine(1518)-N(6)/adenine(1519)-N(6))-dimethyltransferase RsmA [Bacteroidales bacterium]
MRVRAKRNLGQHFLRDKAVALRIAGTLTGKGYNSVLEIGPGTGVLTEFLLERDFADFRVIEIDNESAYYLRERFPSLEVLRGDFLKMDLGSGFPERIAVTGNFPYNISSQILFRVLEYRDRVVELTGMFQKEVAERVCASPGNKVYGILSVLIQAYYDTEYLFTVPEHVFSPPPKVKSGVIRLLRNNVESLGCDEALFIRVVKAAFNQRRKTLRNSLRSAFMLAAGDCSYFKMRPEQLSVSQFVELTRWVDVNRILSK